jgi:hypothetical protein
MRNAILSLMPALLLSGCFAFRHAAKPATAVPIPEGLISTTILLAAPAKLHPGDRVDIFADLSGYNPFPPEESPKAIDSKPVRLIGSSLVLGISPGKDLTIAVDQNEAHYLDLFKEHSKFLSIEISSTKEMSPREIKEARPLVE